MQNMYKKVTCQKKKEKVQKSQFIQNKKEWKQHLPNLDILINVYS